MLSCQAACVMTSMFRGFQSFTLACLSPWYVQQLQKHWHFQGCVCPVSTKEWHVPFFLLRPLSPGAHQLSWVHRGARTFPFFMFPAQRHGLNPACQACAVCWEWEHISCPAWSETVAGWCDHQFSRLQLSWGFWRKCTVTSAGGSPSVPWERHFLCRA